MHECVLKSIFRIGRLTMYKMWKLAKEQHQGFQRGPPP